MHSLSDSIREDFPPADYDQWRAQVETTLKGVPFERRLVTRTYDEIDLQPLYTQRDQSPGRDPAGFPGIAPFIRGSSPAGAAIQGWDLCQEFSHPDLPTTNQSILATCDSGVNSLLLKLDAAARNGLDADALAASAIVGRGGLPAFQIDDFDQALASVDLRTVGVFLDSGAAFLPAGSILFALWHRRGVAHHEARGGINSDPFGVIAREGRLPMELATALRQMADLAKWTSKNFPQVTSALVDTSVYHHAGASSAQDIALALATGVAYLRVLVSAGMDVTTAARQILFRISLGTHHFRAIAKLRAARKVWSRVIDASGGAASDGGMRIHAQIGDRVLTRRDPYVNLLRNTVGVFSAGLGGADMITSVPFDHAIGNPDELSQRIARNTPLILQEESHLNRVIDPTAGSWFIEKLTSELAEKAWSIFQDTEREGGMASILESGWVSAQLDKTSALCAKDVASRKQGITGVSEFPDINEPPIVRTPADPNEVRQAAVRRLESSRPDDETLQQLGVTAPSPIEMAIQAAGRGASVGQLSMALWGHEQPSEFCRLTPRSLAQPFEDLRDASDAWLARTGRRPSAFLANMGPVADHTARATYAKNFFEAGGFEVIAPASGHEITQTVEAFKQSGADIAVICSSDERYPELVPELGPRLRDAGAKSVVLAGNPRDQKSKWEEAGVDRFIFLKCDALAILCDILLELEALPL